MKMKRFVMTVAAFVMAFGMLSAFFAPDIVCAGEKAVAENKAGKPDKAKKLDAAGEKAQTGSNEPVPIGMKDGEYAIGISMEGGSGKVTITSPATLIVEDGKAYAELEWSSTYYDYMKVGGETYLRLNDEGYSTFQIPITALDEPMVVIGDTTAMSVAHEIEYRLTFHTDEITSLSDTPQAAAKKCVIMGLGIMAVCIAISVVRSIRKKNGRNIS